MKFSDNKQLAKAKNNFETSMLEYLSILKVLEEEGFDISIDDYNQLARQITKLTRTLSRIKDRGYDCKYHNT